MRNTSFLLVILFVFTLSVSAQDTAELDKKAHEINIATLREATSEIDRQNNITNNRYNDDINFWTKAKLWAQEVFGMFESGNLTELKIMEAKLAAAGSLSADGKVFIPGYGVTTQQELAAAVQNMKTQIAKTKQTYNDSSIYLFIPGIGNIKPSDIYNNINSSRKQKIDARKQFNEGKLNINYPNLGNITEEQTKSKISSEQNEIKRIGDEVSAGKYVFHSPHLGDTTFSNIDVAIKNAEEEMAQLDTAYKEGTMGINRNPYGNVNRNTIDAAITAKQKELKDLQTQIADGKLSINFGTGNFSHESATAQINKLQTSYEAMELSFSRGTYPVRTAIYGMKDRNSINALLIASRRGALSVPQIGALRRGITHLGNYHATDHANRQADLKLWRDWRDAIPSAAKYKLRFIQEEIDLLKALTKEFEIVYRDKRIVIEKKIARLIRSKDLKQFKSIVLDPYNDNILIYEKERLDIDHHANFTKHYYQSFIDLKETVGIATFKIVTDNYMKELGRQRSFWSRTENAAQILDIGDGTAMVPVLSTATITSHINNCTQKGKEVDELIREVHAGNKPLYVLGLGVQSKKQLDASIGEDKKKLFELSATMAAGNFHTVLPLGAETKNAVDKKIEDNKEIIRTKTEEMQQGNYPVILPVIGRTSKNDLNKKIAAEKASMDDWVSRVETGHIKIFRGGWWFSTVDLENANQAKKKEIADIDVQLTAGTFVGSFTVRMNGQQIDAALKDLEDKANTIKQAVSSKTYSVRMPQSGADVSLLQAEQALANPNTNSQDRSYYQQAVSFVSSASALELRVIDLEKNKYNLWKTNLSTQADYLKTKINLDLNYYNAMEKEFAIEIKNGKAYWDRRIHWLNQFFPYLP